MRKEFIICSFVILFPLGCQDSLHNYAECKKIESARCELRKNCQESGDPDFAENFKNFDYDSCLTYAREHCRTRKIAWDDSEWSSANVQECADGILDLHPGHCKDLRKSDDETEWSILNDACIFIEEREEPEPANSEGPDTEDTDTADTDTADTDTADTDTAEDGGQTGGDPDSGV